MHVSANVEILNTEKLIQATNVILKDSDSVQHFDFAPSKHAIYALLETNRLNPEAPKPTCSSELRTFVAFCDLSVLWITYITGPSIDKDPFQVNPHHIINTYSACIILDV